MKNVILWGIGITSFVIILLLVSFLVPLALFEFADFVNALPDGNVKDALNVMPNIVGILLTIFFLAAIVGITLD